mmetsp:Transcript_5489/g.9304  ORF Transcript_5489/g.9304 Transcript_5489/m.9304 type:complete len:145 (+) Transcript_5489:1267-1701(+)
MDEELSEEELNSIMENVDINYQSKTAALLNPKLHKGFITFSDFLVASIDFSEDSLIEYFREAYKKFFKKSEESIDNHEFTEILCEGKFLQQELVVDIMEQIDEDKSASVDFKELVLYFSVNLGIGNEDEFMRRVREEIIEKQSF